MTYIILYSIFKSLADSLKPDKFDNLILAKYKGTWWDVRAMESKYHNMHMIKYMFYILFGDGWHFSNTCMFLTFVTGLYYFESTAFNFPVHIAMMFVLYGIFFEGTRIILMGKNYKYK